MSIALDMNKISTLSTVLLSNLDESIFCAKISGFIQDMFKEYKVQVFEAYQDGRTQLRAENGKVIEEGMVYAKGQGLSGYVVRTKRAYYSNSSRDPLLATTKRDECVEAEVCVPVNHSGNVIATIHVQAKDGERKFSDEDIQIINNVLTEIDSAVKNMRLYLIAKNLNRELQTQIKEKEEQLSSSVSITKSKSTSCAKIEMIGHSNAFVEVVGQAKKIAKEDFPVLINGEVGTGKKLLAKMIHSLSDRKASECAIVHCSALAEEQLELELFGTQDRPGIIQRSNGGTIILDAVEEISESIQGKLLRLIVSGELFTTDSNMPTAVNVRFISVSRNSLQKRVEEGKFKEELMYRLNIMSIMMPSLGERQDDIKLLSEYFINKINMADKKILTSKAVEKLSNYNWPGNIHELKNLMERTGILVSDQYIDQAHLPDLEGTVEVQEEEVQEIFSEMTLHDLEKMHICKTLDHLGGNKTRAAKVLGITVKTLYNKLHSYGLVNTKTE